VLRGVSNTTAMTSSIDVRRMQALFQEAAEENIQSIRSHVWISRSGSPSCTTRSTCSCARCWN